VDLRRDNERDNKRTWGDDGMAWVKRNVWNLPGGMKK